MADGSIVIDTKIDGSGLSKQVDDLKGKLDDLGKTLTVAVTAPITALGVFATKAFSDAEKGDARLRASLEMTGQNVEQMFDKYQKLGSAIQEVTDIDDDAVKALATFATQLGVTEDSMEGMIKGAIGLSKITGVDLQTAMKMATAAAQGEFGMLARYNKVLATSIPESEKMAIVQRMMANGFKLAEAEGRTFSGLMSNIKNALGELGEQFGQIIAEMLMPFALWLKNLVRGFQELDAGTKKTIVTIALILAAIGPTILAFAKLISAITAVRSAFLALQSVQIAVAGTTAAIAAVIVGWIALIILAFADWESAISGMPQALQLALVEMLNMILDFTKQFLKKIETLMTAIAIITAPVGGLFGKAAFEGLQALVEKSSDKTKSALDRLSKSQERGAKSADKYALTMKKLNQELGISSEKAESANEAQESINKYLRESELINKKIIDGLYDEEEGRNANLNLVNETIDALYELGFSADAAAKGSMAFGDKYSAELVAIRKQMSLTGVWAFAAGKGMNVNLAKGLQQSMHIATTATKKAVEIIAGAFQKTMAIFSAGFSILSWMSDFSPADLFESFSGFMEGLTEFFEKDLGSIPIFFNMAVQLVDDFLKALMQNLPVILETIGNIIESMVDYLGANSSRLTNQVLTVVVAIIKELLKHLPKIVETAIESLIDLLKDLKKIIPPLLKAFNDAIGKIIETVGEHAPELTRALVRLFETAAKGLIENSPTILRAFANALPYIIVAFSHTLPQEIIKSSPFMAFAIIKALIMALYMVPQGIGSALYDLGGDMVDGIVEGFKKAGDIWQQVKEVFTKFIDAVKNFFGIASPSKLFMGFGVDIIQGLVNGISSMFGALESIVKGIGDILVESITAVITLMFDAAKKIGEAIVSGIKDGFGSFDIGSLLKVSTSGTSGGTGGTSGIIGTITNPLNPGGVLPTPSIPKPSNPFKKKLFAMGTRSAPGGLAMVGERGPELVGLSKGSQVFTATKTGQLLNSIMQGMSNASGLGNMTPSGAYAGQNITLNNKMYGTLSVDGREIGRIAFENIDRFAMGAYGYNR